jgi:hypothetical protein
MEGQYPASIDSKIIPPLWGRLSLLQYISPDKLDIVDLADVKRHDPEPDESPHSYQGWWDREDLKYDTLGRMVFHV